MSSIKSNVINNNRTMFNTTIDKDTLGKFKDKCKESGIPMNIVIETFMTQFVNEEFKLRFSKNNKLNVDIKVE